MSKGMKETTMTRQRDDSDEKPRDALTGSAP